MGRYLGLVGILGSLLLATSAYAQTADVLGIYPEVRASAYSVSDSRIGTAATSTLDLKLSYQPHFATIGDFVWRGDFSAHSTIYPYDLDDDSEKIGFYGFRGLLAPEVASGDNSTYLVLAGVRHTSMSFVTSYGYTGLLDPVVGFGGDYRLKANQLLEGRVFYSPISSGSRAVALDREFRVELALVQEFADGHPFKVSAELSQLQFEVADVEVKTLGLSLGLAYGI